MKEEQGFRGPVRYARGGVHFRITETAPAISGHAQPNGSADEAKLSVAFILLHEFTLFAFSGFVDALRIAGDEFDNSRQRECRWTVIAPTLQPVRANCGVEITPWETFPDPAQFDYVVVIGGRMEPQRNTDPRTLEYLRRVADLGVSIVGVCTATFVLARAGVMKGRRCCVHWNARSDFEEEFPELPVDSDTIFLEDSDRITCPGGQSSADVALHLIGKHCGAASARKAAAGMVLEEMRGHRTPQPHAEASWFGDIRKPLVRRAITIMDRFISKDLSVTEIARRLQVSNNTLYRTFQQTAGESPARFFRIMRLAHGHWSLHHTNMSIAQIAHVYRFSDASHFTRMHRLLYGMPPAQARALGDEGSREAVQAHLPEGIVGSVLAGGLLFIGDAESEAHAKTALGLRDWARESCLAQMRLPGAQVDLSLPEMNPAQAAQAGARSLVIGVAPVGGQIPREWEPILLDAVRAGLDVVSGMHAPLDQIPELAASAAKHGASLLDVRLPRQRFPTATGRRRSGKRLLTVGTDCALGKKYTALALTQGLRARGIDADFRATGQTGIMIAGSGVAIDAVTADFAAGAAEALSPGAAADHWDVIEGQGSLFHPAYAGVTLALLHGSQPDVLILCHDPTRTHLNAFPEYPTPSLRAAARLYLETARLTNAAARLAGVSLNTSMMSAAKRETMLAETAALMNVPCFDPLQTPLAGVLDRITLA